MQFSVSQNYLLPLNLSIFIDSMRMNTPGFKSLAIAVLQMKPTTESNRERCFERLDL